MVVLVLGVVVAVVPGVLLDDAVASDDDEDDDDEGVVEAVVDEDVDVDEGLEGMVEVVVVEVEGVDDVKVEEEEVEAEGAVVVEVVLEVVVDDEDEEEEEDKAVDVADLLGTEELGDVAEVGVAIVGLSGEVADDSGTVESPTTAPLGPVVGLIGRRVPVPTLAAPAPTIPEGGPAGMVEEAEEGEVEG